jgi:NDP-sugar pyrophosphorylase family protein
MDKYHDNYFFREFTIKQNGVFLGRGAEVKNLYSVNEKSIIGRFSTIHPNSFVKSRCVVSDFSNVSEGVELEDIIIYEPSHIPRNISISKKIIVGGSTIDPYDKVHNVKPSKNNLLTKNGETIWIKFAALCLFILSVLPSVIIELLFLSGKKRVETYKDLKGVGYRRKFLLNDGVFSRLYENFNLLMAFGYLKVVRGELFLIGKMKHSGEMTETQSLFLCTDFVMDPDFRIGGDVLEKYHEHKRSFFL